MRLSLWIAVGLLSVPRKGRQAREAYSRRADVCLICGVNGTRRTQPRRVLSGCTKVRIASVRPRRSRTPERERDGVHVDLRGALQTDADLQILLLQLHAGESDKAVVHRDDDVLLARDVGELGIELGAQVGDARPQVVDGIPLDQRLELTVEDGGKS